MEFPYIRRLLIEKKTDGYFISTTTEFLNLLTDFNSLNGIHINKCERIQRNDGGVRIILATDVHKYCISFIPPKNRHLENKGYLGCIVSNRYSRLGENWTRGSDLPDGEPTFLTWEYIIAKIYDTEYRGGPRPITWLQYPLHMFLLFKRKIKNFFERRKWRESIEVPALR